MAVQLFDDEIKKRQAAAAARKAAVQQQKQAQQSKDASYKKAASQRRKTNVSKSVSTRLAKPNYSAVMHEPMNYLRQQGKKKTQGTRPSTSPLLRQPSVLTKDKRRTIETALSKSVKEHRQKRIEAAQTAQKNATDQTSKDAADQQMLDALYPVSEADRTLPAAERREIQNAKKLWSEGEEYKRLGYINEGRKAQASAHRLAEAYRAQHGYSGGGDGSYEILPELDDHENFTMTDQAKKSLRAQKLLWDMAKRAGDKETMAQARENARNIRTSGQSYDINRIRESKSKEPKTKRTDVNGKPIYTPTQWEAEGQANFFPAVGKGIAGSLLALGETAHQATLNTLRNRDNKAYQSEKRIYENWVRKVAHGQTPKERGRGRAKAEAAKARMDAAKYKDSGNPYSTAQFLLKDAAKHRREVLDSLDGKGAKLLAEAGMSALQMAPALAVAPLTGGAGSAALMGAMAAGQKAGELTGKGVSAQEALGRGLLSGAIEGATERIPIGRFFNLVKNGGGASVVENVIKQAGIEATEESASYVMNWLADKAAKDPDATFSLQELADNAAVGAISGAGFGSVGSALGHVSNPNQAQRSNPLLDAIRRAQDPSARMQNRPTAESPGEASLPEQNGGDQAGRPAEPPDGRLFTPVQDAQETGLPMQEQAGQEPTARRPAGNVIPFSSYLQDRQNTGPASPDRLDNVGAARGGFDPYSRMLNEYGAIQPGENPARLVDVPRSTDGQDRVRQSARTFMEAEATSEELVGLFQDGVVKKEWSYKPKTDRASVNRAVSVIQDHGYDGALEQWEQVASGQRTCTKDDIVLAEIVFKAASKAGDTATAKKLAAEIATHVTTSGQVSQAIKLLKKATPEGQLYYVQNGVDRLNQELHDKLGKKFGEDITIPDELAQDLLDAQTEEERLAAVDAIYDHVAAQVPRTGGMRMDAWRYFAMLGNPRTHIRNVVGNLIMQAPIKVRNTVSAGLQTALLPKDVRTRTLARSRAAREFAKQDFEQNKDLLKGNPYTTSERGEIMQRVRDKAFTVDARKKGESVFWKGMDALMKPLQGASSFNSWALDAEDMAFKKSTYINSLANFLATRGIDPSSQQVPPELLEEARGHAIDDALEATFQDYSALASKLAELEEMNKASKLLIGGLVPFKKTPINIVKRSVEFSPFGLAKGIYDKVKEVPAGNKTATEAIDEISSGLTGTGIAALGIFLAAKGLINAGDEEDDRLRDFGIAQGSQEYSLNLKLKDGDYSYTIDWAAPSVVPLFLGVEVFNAIKDLSTTDSEEEDEGETPIRDIFDASIRLLEPMMNMTMLSGVSGAIQSSAYSQGNPISGIASNVMQNYLGQFVPTLSGQIARTVDDTRRTTFYDRNKDVPKDIQMFLQRQQNKIPGLSKRSPEWLDSWGRPDKTENPLLRALENFISPGYISKKDSSRVDAELQRLYETGKYEGMLPKNPEKSAKINEKYMTAEQYQKYAKTKGSEARKMLEGIIGSPQYQALSDDEKAKVIEKAFSFGNYSGKEAAGETKQEFDSWFGKLKEGRDQHGISPAEFLSMYIKKNVIDQDESIDNETQGLKVAAMIDGNENLNDDQKEFLKDNLKIYNMNPVDTGPDSKYQQAIDAGFSPEDAAANYDVVTGAKAYGDDNKLDESELERYLTEKMGLVKGSEEYNKYWSAYGNRGWNSTKSLIGDTTENGYNGYTMNDQRYSSAVNAGFDEKTAKDLSIGRQVADQKFGNGNGSPSKAELTAYIKANYPKEQWRSVYSVLATKGWKNPF